jgi:hypothetical protein
MTIMELALTFKWSVSLMAVFLLLAVVPACTEKPTPKPASSNTEKKEVVSSGSLKKVDPPPSLPEKSTNEPKPEPKDIEEVKPDIKESKDVKADEKAQSDIKQSETEEEKPMTDEEIIAANAARRKAALKEIIDKLGPPLVEDVDKLAKAHPLYPVWIDKNNKRIILEGVICQTNAPLEMFAVTSGTKEHEAIIAIPTEAYIVHAALTAIGAKAGKPAEFGPKPTDYKPATGTEIEIAVKWKNEKGEIQTARAQEWLKNVKTGKDMQEAWVFGGSGFWKDEQTGIEYYKAEGGDFICVSNFPSAMLDLPIESSQLNDDLTFQANSERIPSRDTPVTLILTPKFSAESEKTGPEGTQSLMMMVDPRIIIQGEEEEKLGISSGP